MTVVINGTSGITSVNGTAGSPSVTGTDTDTGIVYGTNTLSLATGGTAALNIDSSQNVGIGTSSPAGFLDIQGTQTFSLLMTRFGSSANTALRRASGTQASPTVIANGDTIHQVSFQGYDGVSAYQNAAQIKAVIDGSTISASSMPGALIFGTTTSGSVVITERARFNSTGAFVLAGGSTSASGIGIAFPATQSASSDANTLDDYEEGTWTPTFISTGATFTYAPQYGTYIKIGRLVYAQFYLNATASGTTTNSIYLGNLPFSPSSASAYDQSGVAAWCTSTVGIIQPLTSYNDTTALLWKTGGGGTASAATAANLSGCYFVGTVMYRSNN